MRFHSGNATRGCQRWAMAWGGAAVLALTVTGCASTSTTSVSEVKAAVTPESTNADAARRARIRMELAANYLQAGQPQVALGEVDQAIAAEPRNADAYNLQGLVLMALQDYTAAQTSLDRSLALKPGDPHTLHNMGWLQCVQGRYGQGIALLDQALQTPRYGEQAKTLMSKAMCQRQSGDLAAAEQTFSKAYEIDAGSPMIAYHLADLLFKRQEVERARFYIRRLNNGEYANAESLWLGIRVERALGDTSAMRQLANQLQRRFPDSKEWQRYEQGAFHG
ncbi:MAG: type IV pilus biogenesis/stability protein PilW [Comamonas sp.]